MLEVKSIFGGGFKFAASAARNNFDSTASAVQREGDQSISTSTQENQKLGGKLNHNPTGEKLGSNQGAIREQLGISERKYGRGQSLGITINL